MTDAITGSWSPWVSGLLIGLMVPGLYLLIGRRFGISSSLRHIGAMCMPNSQADYLKFHKWRDHSWNLVLVIGIIGGAAVAATALTADPLPILPDAASTGSGLIRLAFGGVLIGFGTRYAGGCTSGHTISGISSLNPASMVATAAFFAGGLISTWVLPFLIFEA